MACGTNTINDTSSNLLWLAALQASQGHAGRCFPTWRLEHLAASRLGLLFMSVWHRLWLEGVSCARGAVHSRDHSADGPAGGRLILGQRPQSNLPASHRPRTPSCRPRRLRPLQGS
eukprot:6391428-Prymnesium_polylepis.2